MIVDVRESCRPTALIWPLSLFWKSALFVPGRQIFIREKQQTLLSNYQATSLTDRGISSFTMVSY